MRDASSSYNQGEPTDRRDAIRGAVAYTTLLSTLATGTVVLSATFLADFYAGHDLGLLIFSWAVLAVSVLAGLIALGDSIKQLAESTLNARRSTMEVANLFQFLMLAGGVALFVLFVTVNVTAAPAIAIDRGISGVENAVGQAIIVCPSDAADGCTGTVAFALVRSGAAPIALGTGSFATDGPGLSTVSSPRVIRGLLRASLARDQLKISVHAQGRYGNMVTFTEHVPAVRSRTVG